MVSNQVLGARNAAGLLILSVALFACSHAQHQDAAAAAPTPVTANATTAQAQGRRRR